MPFVTPEKGTIALRPPQTAEPWASYVSIICMCHGSDTYRSRMVGSDINSAMEGMPPPCCTRFILDKVKNQGKRTRSKGITYHVS